MLWGRLLPFLSADPQRVPVSALGAPQAVTSPAPALVPAVMVALSWGLSWWSLEVVVSAVAPGFPVVGCTGSDVFISLRTCGD